MHVHFKIVALSGESVLGRLWSGTLVPSITLHFLASPVTWCKCGKMWTSVISGVGSILYIFLKLQVNKERRERLSPCIKVVPGVLTLRPPWVDGILHVNPSPEGHRRHPRPSRTGVSGSLHVERSNSAVSYLIRALFSCEERPSSNRKWALPRSQPQRPVPLPRAEEQTQSPRWSDDGCLPAKQGWSRHRHLLTQISFYCIKREYLEGRL